MDIPIISINIRNNFKEKKELGSQIFRYLTENGFFYVKHTIFTDKYVSNLYEACKKFFDLPDKEKYLLTNLYRFKKNLIYAYLGIGTENIGDNNFPENKEVLEFWTEGGYNTNYILKLLKCDTAVIRNDDWISPFIQSLKGSLLNAYEYGFKYVCFLLECLAIYLGENENFFVNNLGGNNNFRITRSILTNKDDSQHKTNNVIRIGEHEDHGCFTCVIHEKDHDSGFQVYNNNCWEKIHREKDAIYIHAGNMLSLWTNGKIPATLHRVVDPGWKKNRHAINLFVGTNQDVTVCPITSCINDNGKNIQSFIAKDVYKQTSDKHARHVLRVKN